MNDIPTFALMSELYHRMGDWIYDPEPQYDILLADMPKEDTMGMYFALEEYMLCYKELIEERRDA